MEMEFNMKTFNSMGFRLFAAGLLSASVMVGCGSDKKANSNAPVASAFGLTAALGALEGASCDVISADGTILDIVTTTADGTVPVNIQASDTDFPIIVECSGGNYFDEGSEGPQLNTSIIKSLIPTRAALTAVANNLAVTTLTDLAVELFKSLPENDRTSAAAVASLDEIIRVLAPELGANGGGLNLLAGPTPVTSSGTVVSDTPAGKYAAYLAGLALVAQDQNTNAAGLGAILAGQVRAGNALDTATVTQLVNKVKAYAQTNGDEALQNDVSNDDSGAGGTAKKPTGTGATGGTGGTGGTGATGAGATGG
jgi:hypothetical protein